MNSSLAFLYLSSDGKNNIDPYTVFPVDDTQLLFRGNGFKEWNIQKTKIMASGPITSWQIDGETVETVSDFTFWAPKSLQMVTAAMKLKDACSLEEKL